MLVKTTENLQRIPTTSGPPAYQFKVALDGAIFTVFLAFNDRMQEWVMSVFDSNLNPLRFGLPMLPSYPLNWRLAQRFPAMPEGVFFVVDEAAATIQEARTPGRQDLGATENLIYNSAT